jgi:hypothetical protein
MTAPRIARALMFGAILIPTTGCDTTPETPGNAVIEFLMAAQGGDDDAADDRLCRRLRENGTAADLESIDLVVGASVFGEGTISQTDSMPLSHSRSYSLHPHLGPRASPGSRTW